jgi:prepilin-type N-terminal cleavage/methylation domain-containing protein
MPRGRGFTLVELLVVLAILGFVIALVGPLTVDRIDKARAQQEWLVLDRTVRGLAFRAFADGKDVELRGEGTQFTWKLGDAEARSLDLAHLFFDSPQVVLINPNGVAEPRSLTLRQAGRERSLDLNAWLEDGK